MSHRIVIKIYQNVPKIYFWLILLTFTCGIKMDLIMCEPHCVKLFLWAYSLVQQFDILKFDIFLTFGHILDILTHFLTFYLNPISPSKGYLFVICKNNLMQWSLYIMIVIWYHVWKSSQLVKNIFYGHFEGFWWPSCDINLTSLCVELIVIFCQPPSWSSCLTFWHGDPFNLLTYFGHFTRTISAHHRPILFVICHLFPFSGYFIHSLDVWFCHITNPDLAWSVFAL